MLTRNEARALINQPQMPEGDELITPLNVQVGGKPSPQVMPIQNPLKPEQDGCFRKEAIQNGHKPTLETALVKWADRYEKTVKSAGMDVAVRRDPRWVEELADDLEAHVGPRARHYAGQIHKAMLDRLREADNNPNLDHDDVFGTTRVGLSKLAATLAPSEGMELREMKEIGVPQEVLWERAGFSVEEIDRMRALRLAESLSAGESPLD